MKRLLSAVLAALAISAPVYALGDQVYTGVNQRVYISENTTGLFKTTYVPTSGVDPYISPYTDRILGFDVTPITSISYENVAGLYDATTSAQLTGPYFMGEAEGGTAFTGEKWFPYPVRVANGIAIVQGAKTRVNVYYLRTTDQP
ncbi:MAG: hypothetical protein WC404_00270 [Candidatus Omnitrophota bacterium]